MKVACVIPVHNEALVLEASVRAAHAWGRRSFGDGFELVISENGSTDASPRIAATLSQELPGVRLVRSSEAGKGGAIKRGMAVVEGADVYLMMDADLSTDLASATVLAERVLDGSPIAIGSRRMPDSIVKRPLVRHLSTAVYAALGQLVLGLGVRDLQCGCKAFSSRVRDTILPSVSDEGWFFDTELLARCVRAGFPITEVGVHWTESTERSSLVRLHVLAPQFVVKMFKLRHLISSDV